jgi:hypothetical protein
LFVFSEVCVAQSLLFCVGFCISLFVFSEVCVAQSLLATQTSLKTNNELKDPTQKSKDWANQTPLKQTMIYRTLHRKVKIE